MWLCPHIVVPFINFGLNDDDVGVFIFEGTPGDGALELVTTATTLFFLTVMRLMADASPDSSILAYYFFNLFPLHSGFVPVPQSMVQKSEPKQADKNKSSLVSVFSVMLMQRLLQSLLGNVDLCINSVLANTCFGFYHNLVCDVLRKV